MSAACPAAILCKARTTAGWKWGQHTSPGADCSPGKHDAQLPYEQATQMQYFVDFVETAKAPVPKTADMFAVEARSPMEAIAEAWKSFTVGDRLTVFARVVTELDEGGNP